MATRASQVAPMTTPPSEASRRAAEEFFADVAHCWVSKEPEGARETLEELFDTAIARAVRAKDEEIVRLEKALDDALPPRYRR